LLSLDNSMRPKRIAHLHGSWRETRHMILSRSDYERAYGGVRRTDAATVTARPDEWPLHRRLVWALLATRRLVFVGTSLEDPYLKALLRAVAEDLWNWGQSIHYAIVPLDERSIRRHENDEAEFLRHGVRSVYYDNLNGTYQALDQLINEALERCGMQNITGWLEDVNTEAERTLRSP